MARSGRRPGPTSTPEQILDAARALFAEVGFHGATIRAIAARAGVNPALVHHYFLGKEQLFIAAMDLPINPIELVESVLAAGPRDQLGQRIVRLFVQCWRDPIVGPRLRAVLRAATATESGAHQMRTFVEGVMLARLSALLGVPELRVAALLSQLLGIALAATILRIEPLASVPDDDLVALIAPGIQGYLEL